MHESADQKEKVLNMLLEINSQLEELEEVLQSSFTTHRNKLQMEQGSHLRLCEEKVSNLEHSMKGNGINAREREDDSLTRKQLELKLGF